VRGNYGTRNYLCGNTSVSGVKVVSGALFKNSKKTEVPVLPSRPQSNQVHWFFFDEAITPGFPVGSGKEN